MVRLKQGVCQFGLSHLQQIPPEWDVNSTNARHYTLTIRMFNLKTLGDIFEVADHAIQNEDKCIDSLQILELDVSLNDLTSLDSQHLGHLTQLRVLNVSLNRIHRFTGVEKLQHLQSLDISHNQLVRLSLGLSVCRRLATLNAAMNQIEDISTLPSLNNLRTLMLDHNQLKSLNGVEALPALHELHVQHNYLTDLAPVSACLQLMVLNVAHNRISSLSSISHTLASLRQLQAVTLFNNPVAKDANYRTTLIETTSITKLDNVVVKKTAVGPIQKTLQINTRQQLQQLQQQRLSGKIWSEAAAASDDLGRRRSLMELARQAFHQHIVDKRRRTEDDIRQLQHQIQLLQESYKAYEDRTLYDMDACLKYLSTVSDDESRMFTYDYFRDVLSTPVPEKPWQQTEDQQLASDGTQQAVSRPDRNYSPVLQSLSDR